MSNFIIFGCDSTVSGINDKLHYAYHNVIKTFLHFRSDKSKAKIKAFLFVYSLFDNNKVFLLSFNTSRLKYESQIISLISSSAVILETKVINLFSDFIVIVKLFSENETFLEDDFLMKIFRISKLVCSFFDCRPHKI